MMIAWAVVSADPQCDEPGYLAYVSLFAEREDALQCLRNTAKEDAECIDGEIIWHDKDEDAELPWCEITDGCNTRFVHQLQELEIKGAKS